MHTEYDADDVARMTAALADAVAAALPHDRPIGVVGVRTRGELLAQRLTPLLRDRGFGTIHRGTLDITLYRDDLSEIGPKPLVRPTAVDFDLDGLSVLLVDDVLFTGRSVRAALSALGDFGRPAVIRLLVLVDRGGRELPIQPDFVGVTLKDVPREYRVNVRMTEVDAVDEITVEPKPATAG